MFPLVHYFVNTKILKNISHICALGGLFPDLAAGAGYGRDQAHMMGDDFYAWCYQNNPQATPLAKGIISHGSKPYCVDYYADEYWPGYRKGWCFLQGEKYMEEVARTTHLPKDLIWWKAHNFVEMGCELITDQDHPQLKLALLEALNDQAAICQTATALAAYTGIEPTKIGAVYTRVPDIFAIETISPLTLAQKQAAAFSSRHGVDDADIPAMAALIEKISREIRPLYYPFFEEIIYKTALVLADY